MDTPNSTKKLAKQLGLLKRSSSSIPLNRIGSNKGKIKKNEQIFSYLVVLDFESTCWKDKEDNYNPEIIEFPAVLVNVMTGEIEDKFHYYVQPVEHGKLSLFCTELTGIQQSMVDNGIPIAVCLRLFTDWLHKHIYKKQLFFPSVSKPTGYHKAIFVTWSDWDLNTCLQNECKRKRINYSPYLKSWIDLRKTYQNFYHRKPQGLNGALTDVGIKFEGREHSGIDDAINTAYLAVRMVRDGCILKATKSLILSTDVCNRYDNLSLLNTVGDLNCDKVCEEKRGLTNGDKVVAGHSILNSINKLPLDSSGDSVSCVNEVNHMPESVISINDGSNIKANVIFEKNLNTPSLKNASCGKLRIGLSKHTPVGRNTNNLISSRKLTVTPPLCECGKRSKRKKVVNPGPNTGRVFYSCPLQRFEACKYFQWEQNVMNSPIISVKSDVSLVNGDLGGRSIHKQGDLKKHYKNLFNVS